MMSNLNDLYMVYLLERRKHRPGDLVQRFGDHRIKHQPTVLIDNETWVSIGKPNKVTVTFHEKDTN